ncbi:MAG: DUF4097 family beta strand repeat-containing protein [Ethanoligenens sp.]
MNRPYKRHGSSLPALIVWIIIAALLLCILVSGFTHSGFLYSFRNPFSGWNSSYATKEIKKDLTMDGIHAISINGTSADIHVTASSDDQIHVDAKLRDNVSTEDAITNENGTLSISADSGNRFFWFPWDWHTSIINIALPATYTGDFLTVITSGDMSFPESLHLGKLLLHYTSGDIEGGNITAASADIRGTSGSIQLQSLQSPNFTLRQTSGDITVKQLSGAGGIGLVSGNIDTAITSISGDIKASSISGNIQFSLQNDLSVKVDASCISGDIHSDYPLNYAGAHHASGSVGGAPTYTISAQTTSGNIDFLKS